jgi:hypothetical protein
MDVSFPQRGTMILSLCPKVADRGCDFPLQGGDDAVAIS